MKTKFRILLHYISPLFSLILLLHFPLTASGLEIALDGRGLTSFRTGDTISIDITIDPVTAMYGAALDLTWNRDIITVSDNDPGSAGVQPDVTEGTLLDDDGEATILRSALVGASQGRLVLGNVRSGQVNGIDITVKDTLLTVKFDAIAPGIVNIAYTPEFCLLKKNDLSDITIDTLTGITITVNPQKGDIDGNGEINLIDVISTLQILSDIDLNGLVIYSGADVNDDDVIGVEEAVHNMRALASLP